jgi:hypothetical protein
MPTFDASNAEIAVSTYREGAFAAMGHDLRLRFTSFTIEVRDDLSIEARAKASSLELVGAIENGAVRSGKPSGGDRASIERDGREKVLEASRYPEIVFRSRSVKGEGDGWQVSGHLDLHGAVRDLSFRVERRDGRAVARFGVSQPAFHIKPFRAPLGVLKVKPDLDVEVSAPLPADAEER